MKPTDFSTHLTRYLTHHLAAQRNLSVSRFVGTLLRERMRETAEYESAMRRYLAKQPVKLKGVGQRYPGRDELHERTRLHCELRRDTISS